jgi:maltose O-acetyltransferase
MRAHLLRIGGVDVRENVGVFPHVKFVSGPHVTLHEGVFVNLDVLFDAGARVELQKRVFVAPRAQFLTSSHTIGPPSRRAHDGIVKPITVEEGCWIGAGAIILPGVRVGAGCVIGAGAVVNGDCEPNGLYTGIPARRNRDLAEAGTERQLHPQVDRHQP